MNMALHDVRNLKSQGTVDQRKIERSAPTTAVLDSAKQKKKGRAQGTDDQVESQEKPARHAPVEDLATGRTLSEVSVERLMRPEPYTAGDNYVASIDLDLEKKKPSPPLARVCVRYAPAF